MIKANEAVVGRIFNRELRTARGMEFDHEFVLTEEWVGKLFGDSLAIALEDLHPIPLSPEWLERAGFGLKCGTADEFGLVIENEGILIELSENYIKDGRAVFYYNMPDTETHKCIAYCKFVHQLQNLYHALTGEELTFKPAPAGSGE